MKRIFIGLALGLGLAACGGTPPFGGTTTNVGGGANASAIPIELANNLQSFTYNDAAQTLTVVGVPLDDGPQTGVYVRKPGLDRGGYEAYTIQDGSLDRHNTAYVKRINNTQGAVVVSGVQFEEFFGGGGYSTGSYSPPVAPGAVQDGGLVSYAGRYIGLLNGTGSGEELLPVTPGTSPSATSVQAAEVVGNVLVTGDFGQTTVDGVVYNRTVQDYNATGNLDPNSANPLIVPDLAMDATGIETDGTFFGTVSVANQVRGEYGGIFGGTGATEVAGVVHAKDHISEFQNEEEYGIFVLAQCGQPQQDPVCNQPVP